MNSGKGSKLPCTLSAATKDTRPLMRNRANTQFQSLLVGYILDSLPWQACESMQLLLGNRKDWAVRHKRYLLRWVRGRWKRSDYSFCRWYRFWGEWEGWCTSQVGQCSTFILFTVFHKLLLSIDIERKTFAKCHLPSLKKKNFLPKEALKGILLLNTSIYISDNLTGLFVGSLKLFDQFNLAVDTRVWFSYWKFHCFINH